jgi:drug/metabolite transporter (DMT)-like permease
MKIRIWLGLLAVYISWGTTYLAIRFAVETIPPFLMAATRFLIAGLIVYTWRRLAGDPRPSRLQWRSAAIIGLLLLTGGIGGVAWAEQRVASGVAALIVASSPLWMVLIDALRRGGALPRWQTSAGVLVGLLGIVLLVDPSVGSDRSLKLDSMGVLALSLAAFLWAVGSLYSRHADLPASPLMGTGMEMLAGSAGLFVMGTLIGEWGSLNLQAITARSLLGLAYLVIAGSLVGFVAYTWLLRVAPTPLVATYAYVNPLIAVLVGSLWGEEALMPRLVLAALVIVAGVVLINLGRRVNKTGRLPERLELSPAHGED